MKKLACFLMIVLLAANTGSVMAQSQQPAQAKGEFKTSVGETVGNVTLTQMPDGMVHVSATVRGLPPGEHGIHIHAVGACSPNFDAAGAHYNPANKEHGLQNPAGPHAGDMPTLTVKDDGTGTFEALTDRVTVAPGAQTIFDADGSAIIIHAFADDQQTNPTGNSGGRIACAVLQPETAAPAAAQPSAQPAEQPTQLPTTGANDLPWLVLALAALLLATGALARRSIRIKE
jgi:superoxide dismutase, Cu-Zn family